MAQLILISVPIGNLDDITLRVLKVLQGPGIFAVEDTRSFKMLLSNLQCDVLGKEIFSFHDHSSKSALTRIMNCLKEGHDVYLASEAGSPIISDPAFPVIQEVLAQGFTVDSYSGVSSLLMAVELSGLSPLPFTFYGFFPRDIKKLKLIWSYLIGQNGSHYFFESPQRLIETMNSLSQFYQEYCQDNCHSNKRFESGEAGEESVLSNSPFVIQVVILRELSKKFQSIYRFPLAEWEQVCRTIVLKGELVVGIERSGLLSHSRFVEEDWKNQAKALALDVWQQKGKSKMVAKLLGHLLHKEVNEMYLNLKSAETQRNDF